MRTYNARKKYGASTERRFLSVEGRKEKPFDFFEFLVSGGKKLDAPDIMEYLDTLKYPDGSYDFGARAVMLARSAPDIHGTCYAVCALKAMGMEPPSAALDYIEGLKNDEDGRAIASATNIPDVDSLERLKEERGSFRSGPDKWDGDVENTHWAVLALRLGGRGVPKESADYASSLRNPDGSYCMGRNRGGDSGFLRRTRQALTILRAAGQEEWALFTKESEKTAGYIVSRLGEDGFGNIENCYDAIVSLNLLGVELGPEERELVGGRVNAAKPSSVEKKFKAAVVKKCVGLELSAGKGQADDLPAPPSSAREALYALWLKKLLLLHETPKKPATG